MNTHSSDHDGEAPHDASSMPLMEHLIELRQRLLRSMVALVILFFICYYFAADIYGFLVRPLADALHQGGIEQGGVARRLIFTGLHEAFFTYVKVAFFSAVFIAFPFISLQVWGFVAPGLYKGEKRVFAPFLVATPLLFFMGGAMVYFYVFPLAWEFFLSFESSGTDQPLPIQLEAKVDQYLSLVMRLIFAFGICFELPVVLTLLAYAGFTTAEGLRKKRKYAIVIAFIAAAILTPPDVISQVGLAVPTIILYEISIFAVQIVEKHRSNNEQATDDADDDSGDDNKGNDDDDTAEELGVTP